METVKHQTKYRFEQSASGAVHRLYIYDEVSAQGKFNWNTWEYEDSETSAKYFRDQLDTIPDGETIELHINSAGGDVGEGVAIYNLLRQKAGTGSRIVGYVDTQKVLTAFGLTAEDAGGILDTMNAVGQRTGINMDDLAKSIITNSASLQQMGFNASDAANFLGNVEMSGADTSQVMSGLTKALSNATAEGKPMSEALAEIQSSMVNAGSETEGLQAAYDLFGKKAGAAIYQACKEGSLSFEELGTSMQDSMGSVDDTYERILDGTDALKTGMNTLKVAGAELGGTVGDTLAPMIEKASEKIAEVTKWFSELSPKTQSMIVKIGLVAAAIGPVLVIIGTLISSVGTIVGALGTLTTFLGGIAGAGATAGGGIALFSGPLLPIAGIIAGVVAAGVLLYQNWDTIKEKAGELKEKAAEKFDDLKEKTKETWTNMKEDAKEDWEDIREDIHESVTNAKNKVTEGWKSVEEKTTEAWTNVQNKVQEKGGGIKGVLGIAVEGYKSLWSAGFTTIDQLTGGKLGNAQETVRSKMESIRSTFFSKMDAAQESVRSAIDKIKGFFNFSWSLPKIKLPHFSITGGFSLTPPKVPSIDVSWYKDGGILSGAQIFGQMGSKLLGGGEAGKEAVLPLDSFYSRLGEILNAKVAGMQEKLVVEMPIYINGNYTETEITEIAMKGISKAQKYKANGAKVRIRR